MFKTVVVVYNGLGNCCAPECNGLANRCIATYNSIAEVNTCKARA